MEVNLVEGIKDIRKEITGFNQYPKLEKSRNIYILLYLKDKKYNPSTVYGKEYPEPNL